MTDRLASTLLSASLLGLALGLGGGLGCDSAERRDAETVVAAVSRFRTAESASAPAMVEALKATPCNRSDTCKARDECASTGDATARAVRLKNEVERGLAAIERGTLAKDSPEAKELPRKLDDAEVLLKQGFDGLGKCDEAVQALKRRYRI